MSGRHIPIFVNELSYPLSEADAQSLTLKFLRTLRRVKLFAPDVVLGSKAKLTEIPLTETYRTLASFASGIGKDWWRFLAALQQRSPFILVDGCSLPAKTHFVCGDGRLGEALAWSCTNETASISFASDYLWSAQLIEGQICDCEDDVHSSGGPSSVRNVADETDVDTHRDFFEHSGLEFRGGSLVLEAVQFSLRMPPRDHEPMHVHVCPPGSASETWATVRFDREPEILAGRLSLEQIRAVRDAIGKSRQQLIDNWDRRRRGLPAVFISDH